MTTSRRIAWEQGKWTHPPVEVRAEGEELLVTGVEGSDAWRVTGYGFTHESEHALLVPLPMPGAVEVAFTATLPELFDQAGVFLRGSDTQWIKAGIERSEGTLQLSAVVTDECSDWSLSPVSDWAGRIVTIRASRSGDAVTIRARVGDDPFRLVRVIPLAETLDVQAGPYMCAPTRSGLTVRFHSWTQTAPDPSLH